MRLLGFRDLRGKGIPFSRQHIHRLVRQKKFPRPGKVGDRINAWLESQIDDYIEHCFTDSEMKKAQSA